MKMAIRRHHDLASFLGAGTLALSVLACNLAGVTEGPERQKSPGAATSAACLEGILPGKTTKNEVMALIGSPLATVQDAGMETLQYASSVYGQANSIAIQNGVVALVTVVQAADKPVRWSEINTQLGTPAFSAYTNYQQGSKTYVYPERGRAFIADEAMDAVFIQQCFVPMKLDAYMLLYGNFLPAEDPFTQ